MAHYDLLEKWCAAVIGERILKSKDNAKFSNKTFAIIRHIVKNNKMVSSEGEIIEAKAVLMSYSVNKFIVHHDSAGELTPKLALLMLLFTTCSARCWPSTDILSHLILTLGNIYASAASAIRLIVMRILMSIHSTANPTLSAMIRKVNNSKI